MPGETVLVLGATGVSGRLVLPIAKHLRAGWVVAAGRKESVLRGLSGMGADAVISLRQSDSDFTESLVTEHARRRIDIVLDFLWGRPAELTLMLLRGKGDRGSGAPIRFVSVGSAAAGLASVPSVALRNSDLQLLGSGLGNLPPSAARDTLPALWALACTGAIPVDVERVPLTDIASAWARPEESGRRRVVVP